MTLALPRLVSLPVDQENRVPNIDKNVAVPYKRVNYNVARYYQTVGGSHPFIGKDANLKPIYKLQCLTQIT